MNEAFAHPVGRLIVAKRKWIAALGAIVAAAASLAAQEPVPISGWNSVLVPGFTVLSQLDAAHTRAYAEQIELMRRAMRGHIEFDPRILPPFTAVIFQNRGNFISLVPAKASGVDLEDIQSEVGGYNGTMAWGEVSATAEAGSNEDTHEMILEGAVGWLLNATRHPLPLTLRIGIVKVFGTFYVEDGQEYIGRPPRGITARLAIAAGHQLSARDRFVPVESMLADKTLAEAVARQGFQMFYAESWGFAHFLLFSKEMSQTHALNQLIEALGRGLSPHAALQQALGPAAKDIDSRFLTYVHGGDFFEVRTPVENTGLSAGAAPPAEAAKILALLASAGQRASAARSYAQDAVRLDPIAASYDTLALVESDAGRDEAATAAAQTAIKLGSRDGWTWNVLARSLARRAHGAPLSPGDAREVMNLDEKAVNYRHDLKADFDFIADLVGTADRVTEDDGKFILFGRKLFPADGWLEVGQAQWARRSGEAKLAQQLFDDALAHPETLTPKQIDQARALRDSHSHS